MEEEEARTLAALAFGEKAWMDSDVKTQYQESGIAHIASISGLHLSMLGAGLYQVLRRGVPWIPVAALLSGGIMAGVYCDDRRQCFCTAGASDVCTLAWRTGFRQKI